MGRRGGKVLIIIASYIHVENDLGPHLSNSQILWDLPMSPGTGYTFWTRNREDVMKGVIPRTISWDMYRVCMDCYSR